MVVAGDQWNRESDWSVVVVGDQWNRERELDSCDRHRVNDNTRGAKRNQASDALLLLVVLVEY